MELDTRHTSGRLQSQGTRGHRGRRVLRPGSSTAHRQREVENTGAFKGCVQRLRSALGRLYGRVCILSLPAGSWTTLGIAAFVGILHWLHLTTLFENDHHFSHLSSLEREMTFHADTGLYYSYFKTIVEAPSFLEGLWMIMNDWLTEYPRVINAVKRFHLYPEVVVACWYRAFMGITNFFGIETKTCWTVRRMEPHHEVQSCEGMGDPAYFYVGVIFILNGLTLGLFFIYATYLSGNRLGGLLTVMCYFFNHGEATRVMWTPPLRESFSYPFLVLQMYILTMILRTSNNRRGNSISYIALCLSNVAIMLPWQDAQFILFTQIASLLSMYVVGYIEPRKFQKIIYMSMVSVILCFILMFGNPVYLSSYYSSSLLMALVIIVKRNKIQTLGLSELNLWLFQGCAWWCGTIILKFLTSAILGLSDHISVNVHIPISTSQEKAQKYWSQIELSDLITARLLQYTDFNTLLYTCAPEFDFMKLATLLKCTTTILLPVVVMINYFIFKKIIRGILCALSENTCLKKQLLNHGELVFHTAQLLVFAALAMLFLRLKLFLVPHMCVMASLICSRQLFGWLFCRVTPKTVIFGLLVLMSIQGCTNLQEQWSIKEEFTNMPQEELIQWIKYTTRPDAVFAGTLPTMASIKLSTLHPIVSHPLYEDEDLRARTKTVYSMYSRKSVKEVRDKLLELHVNYYVLQDAWCVLGIKPGCSMLEMWDVDDPSNAASPPLCCSLLEDLTPYFTTVFQNSVYRVLEMN